MRAVRVRMFFIKRRVIHIRVWYNFFTVNHITFLLLKTLSYSAINHFVVHDIVKNKKLIIKKIINFFEYNRHNFVNKKQCF